MTGCTEEERLERVFLLPSAIVVSVEGKRTDRFSEKSLNLESSFKFEVRFSRVKGHFRKVLHTVTKTVLK
jgi:hypothetical protein